MNDRERVLRWGVGSVMVAVVVVMAVTAWWAFGPRARRTTSQDPSLEQARDRWAAAGIENYTWTVTQGCFCDVPTITVTVRDGRVDRVVDIFGEVRPNELGLTVDDVFDRIDRALATGTGSARYDTTDGHPLEAGLDPFPAAVDDEWGFGADDFRRE